MITTPMTMIITAAASGAAGLAMAPWLRRFVEDGSQRPRGRLLGLLAAAGGAGAAAVSTGWPELITLAMLAIGLAALLLVDLVALRLPDLIVGPLYLLVTCGLTVQAAIGGDWLRLLDAAISGAVLLACYFVLGLIGGGRLGLGDVKLSGLLGLALGWLGRPETVFGSLAGFAIAALASAVLLITARASRRSALPFGPCMIIGAALGAAFGPSAILA